MESKRRPGFPRIDNQEEESGQSLMHKSDNNTGTGQAIFNNWGQVLDKRTEAAPDVMSKRRVAPLKGNKRHDNSANNIFAFQPNHFANLNQNSSPAFQPGQFSGLAQSQPPEASLTSTGPSNNSFFQTHNASQANSGTSFPSFDFGKPSTTAPSIFGNSSNPFQSGASRPADVSQQQQAAPFVFGQSKPTAPSLFSFGQQSSSAPSSFAFGQQEPKQPVFSFGQQQPAQQDSLIGQNQPSQPSIFSFGQQNPKIHDAQGTAQQNTTNSNPFSFLSQQPAKPPEPTLPASAPRSNVFDLTQSNNSQTERHDGLAHNSQPSNPFAQSQGPLNSQNGNNSLGATRDSSTKSIPNFFGQSTQAQQPTASLFSQFTEKDGANDSSPKSQSTSDTSMSSPQKVVNPADDNDMVMGSPTKSNNMNNITEVAPKIPEPLKAADSSSETSQPSNFEPLKFAPLSFQSGPFKNPFESSSITSAFSSAPSTLTSFKPSLSLDGDAFKVPAFTPPFSIGSDNDTTSPSKTKTTPSAETSSISTTTPTLAESTNGPTQSEITNRAESSKTSLPNGPTNHIDTSQPGKIRNQYNHNTDDEISEVAMELTVFNRAFIRALTAMDPTQDHSDMMRAYLSQAEKITKPNQATKRKAADDFNVTVKKAKGHSAINGASVETPGKSRTSNLFASILGNNGTPSGDASDSSPSQNPKKSGPTDTEIPSPSGQISNDTTSVVPTPFGPKNMFQDSPASFKPSSSPKANSNDDSDPATSKSSTGKSLFERIDSTSKPDGQFHNPFANLSQDGAADQTWKAESPIKFGTSQPSSSFLFPGPSQGSAGTSRATTPGTVDGGITSEAESAPSNAGEGNDGETTNDSENPSQAQVDLTTEDSNQEILFETEKSRASIRDTATNSWETRGVGPMRILKHSETGSITVLMRLSPSGKVLLHTGLVKGLSYNAQGSGALLPVANEGGKLERWYIKFKTRDLAEAFADKCEELKDG